MRCADVLWCLPTYKALVPFAVNEIRYPHPLATGSRRLTGIGYIKIHFQLRSEVALQGAHWDLKKDGIQECAHQSTNCTL